MRPSPILILPIFYKGFCPQAFFPKNKEISAPPPCELEYIYFMKIGQPNLAERKSQRGGYLLHLLIFDVS